MLTQFYGLLLAITDTELSAHYGRKRRNMGGKKTKKKKEKKKEKELKKR